MAVIFSWSGDGLSEGSLTTLSAGVGDTPPSSISGSSPTIVASGARSPRIRFLAGTDSGASYVSWSFTAQDQGAGRWYFTSPSNLPSSGHLPWIMSINSSSTMVMEIDITSTGRFNLRDNAGVLQQSPSSSYTPNTTYRIEWTINHGNGLVQANIYEGESTEIHVGLSGTSTNLGSTHDEVNIGKLSSATVLPFYADDIAISDTAELIGKWSAPTGPYRFRFNGVNWLPLDFTTIIE